MKYASKIIFYSPTGEKEVVIKLYNQLETIVSLSSAIPENKYMKKFDFVSKFLNIDSSKIDCGGILEKIDNLSSNKGNFIIYVKTENAENNQLWDYLCKKNCNLEYIATSEVR